MRIRRGSVFVCGVCHQSGFDHLKYFKATPDDPRPDPKPTPKQKPKPGAKETRRERRLRLFGQTVEQS